MSVVLLGKKFRASSVFFHKAIYFLCSTECISFIIKQFSEHLNLNLNVVYFSVIWYFSPIQGSVINSLITFFGTLNSGVIIYSKTNSNYCFLLQKNKFRCFFFKIFQSGLEGRKRSAFPVFNCFLHFF